MPDEDKKEFLHELIISLLENQFKKLKSYVDRGLPFSAWLTVVISNKCRDFQRSKYREKSTVLIPSVIDASEYADQLHSKELTPFEKTAYQTLLAAVKTAMAALPEHCRLMLEMAAEETSFADMQKLLGPQWNDTKKIYDDLRYCRKRLKETLANNGVNLNEWFDAT
ncbi:MAG: sigma-70 family RNA polymerase sigma factor [Candidatus Zixiibacteriota bacterium]